MRGSVSECLNLFMPGRERLLKHSDLHYHGLEVLKKKKKENLRDCKFYCEKYENLVYLIKHTELTSIWYCYYLLVVICDNMMLNARRCKHYIKRVCE